MIASIISSIIKVQHPEFGSGSRACVHGMRSFILGMGLLMLAGACRPKEDVVLRNIKDVVVDAASNEPLLKATALLYNPNNIRMTVKKIDMEIFVDGKKAAVIDQEMKLKVPAQAEFTVPLEVKLNLKEMGFMDTLFGVLGGKRFQIQYKGSIRMQYAGVPFTVPVNHKEEIRVRF